jgi:hypothetical protein
MARRAGVRSGVLNLVCGDALFLCFCLGVPAFLFAKQTLRTLLFLPFLALLFLLALLESLRSASSHIRS